MKNTERRELRDQLDRRFNEPHLAEKKIADRRKLAWKSDRHREKNETFKEQEHGR